MDSLEIKQNLGELNTETPLISIGMLVYNHEKYISDALEGILSQTYENMELIILDDASTDGTVGIINKYMPRLKKKFEIVNFIQNTKNNGNISQNCNIIERKVNGEYYFSVSGDDIILPDCISSLYQQLSVHSKCVLIHANAIYIDDSFHFGDSVASPLFIHEKRVTGIESDTLFQRLMCGNIVAAPTVLLRTSVFEKYGHHDENIAFEDYEYWLRLTIKEKFYYLDRPVVLYRRSESSCTVYDKESGERRLHVAIESDYKTKKKYIDSLQDNEKAKCWEAFYRDYSLRCKELNSTWELEFLQSLLQNESVDVSKYNNFGERIGRQKREDSMVKRLIDDDKDIALRIKKHLKGRDILSAAIYGYSRLGRMLKDELCKAGIHVEYIIDQKGRMLDAALPVYTLDDILPDVDTIIVAPPGLIREVYSSLKEKTSSPILDLEELFLDGNMQERLE